LVVEGGLLLLVHQHPSVSVLELDVDLAQAEVGELFLAGAVGDFGFEQGGFFLALSCLRGGGRRRRRRREVGLDGGIALEEAGCAVALLVEAVEQVGALVV
jgi:hypothetical protein